MDIYIRNTAKADIFAALFHHIKLFTEHINVMFRSDKMYVQAMDNSRILIFEIHLPADWFDEYSQDMGGDEDGAGAGAGAGTGGFTLGVNSSLLFKILTARDRDQGVHIKFDREEEDKLFLNFTSADKNGNGTYDKHFEMPLLDIDSETMNIPTMDYQAEFSIPSANFAALVNQLRMFGDTMQIECSENRIQLCSTSSEAGKMSVDIPIDDLTSFAIQEDETLNLSFSLTQLHNICLYSKLSKDMEISMTTDYPIKCVYPLGQPGAEFLFFLAPKMED